MDIGDAERERRSLPFFEQLLIELLAHLLDQLFDAGRMDTAVLQEPFERNAGDLAADRIEARKDDRFRRVVDDEVDAGGQLERADIAPFTADDASLHVFAGELDYGNRILGNVISGHTLNDTAQILTSLECTIYIVHGITEIVTLI